jgi:hypothetical protein
MKSILALLGLSPAIGVLIFAVVMHQAAMVNAETGATGVTAKLWIFATAAIALHLLMYFAGARVLIGLRQFVIEWHRWSAHKRANRAVVHWRRQVESTVDLDQRLRNAYAGDPPYNLFTRAFFADLNRELAKSSRARSHSRQDIQPVFHKALNRPDQR